MLGLLHFQLWLFGHSRKYLLSMIMAFSAGACALVDLSMMHSTDIAHFQLLLQYQNLFVYILLIALIGLVYVQFGTASRWLAALITVLWSLGLIINFTMPASIVYVSIESIEQHATFWGDKFSVVSGSENPWVWLVNLATLLILIYVIDASIRAWRQGDRRSASIIGFGIVVFLLIGIFHSFLVDHGRLNSPYMISFSYLAVVIAMSYDLISDTVRVPRLTQQIMANEKRWRDLLENIRLAVVAIDEHGLIYYTNPFFQEITGYRDSELLDKKVMSLSPAEDSGRNRNRFEPPYSKDHIPEKQWPVICKSGERRDFLWSSVKQLGTDGLYAGTISIGSDITKQLKAEKELQQSRHELERLTRANMLGELVSALAHELNQPLTSILSNSQAALRFMDSDRFSMHELRDILQDIVQDDKRASEVIRSLRAMLTKSEIAPRDFHIRDTINQVVTIFQSELEKNEVKVRIHIAPEVTEIHARHIEIQQVIMNLLINAVQAMKDLPLKQRMITIDATSKDGMMAVAVSDSGPGISTERASDIFNAFFTTKLGSIGVGLAICKRIIESHGGKITALNNPQGGAVISFTLPT